jgi:hypothetical protein
VVSQLAVGRVPEDGDAVFAAGGFDDGGWGGGRAGCEGDAWVDGAVEFVEVFAGGEKCE